MLNTFIDERLDCAGRRQTTDLFEGFPDVRRRCIFAELSPAMMLGIDDHVSESSFADVESTAIFRSSCAFPSSACSKVIMSEGWEMRGPPWVAYGADVFHWDMGFNGRLESCSQSCHIGVQF